MVARSLLGGGVSRCCLAAGNRPAAAASLLALPCRSGMVLAPSRLREPDHEADLRLWKSIWTRAAIRTLGSPVADLPSNAPAETFTFLAN